MTGRKKAKDHFDQVYETSTQQEEAAEAQMADQDDADDAEQEGAERDGSDLEQVKDPIAKAVAAAEARLRHTHIKPLKAELAQLRQEASDTKALLDTARSLRMENEFLRFAGGTFHDAGAAFKLADLNGVTIRDDGAITGMEEAVRAVGESHPYLLRGEAPDIDDDEEDYEFYDAGPASGRPMNGRRKSTTPARADDATLLRKYPALRRR